MGAGSVAIRETANGPERTGPNGSGRRRTAVALSLAQEMDQMKKLIGCALVAIACASLASAGSAQAQWNDPVEVEALKQIEREMGQAMVAVDLEKLNRIFADNWTSIGASGTVITKEKVLSDFKSGVDRLEAFELGPMDVQVKGNVAVVHGSVIEKRTRAGKDVGGEYVWMDLMEKRNGTWVVARSAGAKVR
jgi:ketosteroid isomerase-like protein